jgi:uncharacterized membrane protein (TIGR02234 family)
VTGSAARAGDIATGAGEDPVGGLLCPLCKDVPVNATASAQSGRSGTREKAVAALLAAAGAGLILISNGRPWADATVTSPVTLSVRAAGSSLTSLPYALGLAGLAGAVALFAVRRVGRLLVGVVLFGAGAGTVAAVVGNLGRLDGAQLAKAADQTLGAGAAQVGAVTNTAWPYVAIVGGVLAALAGALTLARGRSWSGLPSRYEAAPASGEAADSAVEASAGSAEPSARDLWEALNQGADPTA